MKFSNFMNSLLTSLYPGSEASERQNSEKGRERTDTCSVLMSGTSDPG